MLQIKDLNLKLLKVVGQTNLIQLEEKEQLQKINNLYKKLKNLIRVKICFKKIEI
jgi:hypothetical protein